MSAVLIRVNIAGFQGEPATIFGAYDPATDMLAITKMGKSYDGKALEGFLKITNQTRDVAHDAMFTEEEMPEAIRAFFNLESLKLVALKGDATRCNPAHKVERDGMDEGGLKFRFHPDISNQQVAVLAACLYADRQRAMERMTDFAEAMASITV